MSESPSQNPGFASPVLLRQSREAAGLHIAALAAALKVPVRKLEALEAGRYDELPDLTFARALASSACRHLKVDPAAVLAQIPTGHTPSLDSPSGALNAPFRPAQMAPSLAPLDWLRRPAVMVSLALVTGAVGLLFMPDWDDSVASVKSAVAGFTPSSGPAEAKVEPVMPPAPAPEPPVVSAPAVTAGDVPAKVAATPVPATAPPAAPAAPVAETAASAAVLNIRATADAWIEVVDGTGKTQVQRMLKSGDALDFTVAPPYSVVVGRADAVAVTVRGQAFDVSPFARNSVARFQVK
ncbi:helix-turn-helix domain-containing protein [Hydrogenophaga sp. MI9]|uniref:helix-turn-helix domain-containing protein n=1 Tax=Hydrogenophaga sp. MI9 TaxID=3453719 RepID=UPI003EEBCFF3